MRWLPNSGEKNEKIISFNRPVRWILASHGEAVIDFEFAGCKSSNITRSPRFNGSKEITIFSSKEYLKKIQESAIILDQNKRREKIKNDIIEESKKLNLEIHNLNEALIDEVNYLVEYPTVSIGQFDKKFTSLPEVILESVMAKHQRCFPLYEDGSISSKFIFVRNGTDEHIDSVKKGFEKVIRARFSDAQFFIEKDNKSTLESFREKLKKLTFHEKIGSYYDKAERIDKLTKIFSGQIPSPKNITAKKYLNLELNTDVLNRAAYLCKADLGTQMVTEMTSLQGIMGGIYAEKDNEDVEVVKAIRSHYRPVYRGDLLPENNEGIFISLCDKLDTLVAFFSTGIEPTGSADPYGLRREAVGIITLLRNTKAENKLISGIEINLQDAINVVLELLNIQNTEVCDKVLDFILKRLEIYLKEENISHDVINAVLETNKVNPNKACRRAYRLNNVKSKYKLLIEGIIRVQMMFKSAKDKGYLLVEDKIEASECIYVDNYEKLLKDKITELINIDIQDQNIDFFKEIEKIDLVSAINNFFDNLQILSQDQSERDRRLRLINQINNYFIQYADFTKLDIN